MLREWWRVSGNSDVLTLSEVHFVTSTNEGNSSPTRSPPPVDMLYKSLMAWISLLWASETVLMNWIFLRSKASVSFRRDFNTLLMWSICGGSFSLNYAVNSVSIITCLLNQMLSMNSDFVSLSRLLIINSVPFLVWLAWTFETFLSTSHFTVWSVFVNSSA